jgi:hypothetical protein
MYVGAIDGNDKNKTKVFRDDSIARAVLAVGFAYGVRTCFIMIVHHYDSSFIPSVL